MLDYMLLKVVVNGHNCTAVHRRMCVNIRSRTHYTVWTTEATQGPKHASNLTQAISHDKFQPVIGHFLRILRCVRKAGNHA